MTSVRDSTDLGAQHRWMGTPLRDFPGVPLGLGRVGNTWDVMCGGGGTFHNSRFVIRQ